MRVVVLLLMASLVGCSGEDKKGSNTSHYCCTLKEFCVACGCNAAETNVADSKDEAACQQLLDSEDYRCALGDETTALAECVGQSAPSSERESEDSRCVEWGDGCSCGNARRDDDVPFVGTCDESAFDGRAICCQGDNYCRCEPVLCGISTMNGNCLCGVGAYIDSVVASCDGTAGTCCTQDTGYCYCEDGCENRFANRIVNTCNQTTSTATCSDDEVQVASCQ